MVAAELKIIPAARYVQVTYEPIRGLDRMVQRFEEESRRTGANPFVEMLMYSLNEGVLMTGKFTDKPAPGMPVNRIGRWYKPWFYKYVQTYLSKGGGQECIPIRQYYHRHTRSYFWEMEEIIPFGNQGLVPLFVRMGFAATHCAAQVF